MMNIIIFGFLFFFLSVLIFFMSKNVLVFWISLLFSSISSSFFIFSMEKHVLLKYFLIQEFGVVFILSGFMMNWIMMYIGIFLKAGVVPFHNWMINMIFYINKFCFIWVLSLSKFLVTLFCFYIMEFKLIFLVLLVFLINQMLTFWMNMDVKILLFFSSTTNFLWIILVSMFSFNMSLLFLIFYNVLMLSFIPFEKNSWNNKMVESFMMFQLTGLPPSMIFFLKLYIILMILNYNFFLFLFLMMSSLMIVFNYFKSVENNMINIFNNMSSIFNLRWFFLFCSFDFFVICLLFLFCL